MMYKKITGVGSRKTPENILRKMKSISSFCTKNDIIVRTGDAKGADEAFRDGASDKINLYVYSPNNYLPYWTKAFVEYFHPNPKALNEYAYKLMQRNCLQILGENGDNPSDLLVCYTPSGGFEGGTGQTMRICEFYDIPIYNLYNNYNQYELKKMLKIWRE